MKSTDNKIKGPIYLDGLTENIEYPDDLFDFEWRRRLKAENGATKFRIKYYGELSSGFISGTDFSEPLIYAVEPDTGQEILLFDGCKHGYKALMHKMFTNEQVRDRMIVDWYRDDGNDMFEIIISAYYQIDYCGEFGVEMDKNGYLKNDNNENVSIEELRRNGFDCLQISGINNQGNKIDIVLEELA